MRSAWILVASSAWSCGDGEDLKLDISGVEPETGGSSPDAGAGGAPGEVELTGGSAGEREPPARGGSIAGSNPIAAQGGAPPPPPGFSGGQGGTQVDIGVVCSRDDDCDDHLFCNGVERCDPLFENSDAKVCKAPQRGPCDQHGCYEETDTCDCSNPDEDGDLYLIPGCTDGPFDCDDKDRYRNPREPEVCDPDDPWHDEDCKDWTYGFKDEDEDLSYDRNCANVAFLQAVVPASGGTGGSGAFSMATQVYSGNDCNDDLLNVNPHAPEVCDGLDNDCDGQTDEVFGETSAEPNKFHRDEDGDQYGVTNDVLETLCPNPPDGYAFLHGDCDDTTRAVSPKEPERCNGIDDDCDGKTDEPFTPGSPLLDEPFEDGMTFECGGAEGWLVTSCPLGRLECSNPSYRDACETAGTTMCNCHECGRTCSFSCGETACEELSDISVGMSHTCAIARPDADPNASGTVACWGWNGYGQLGNGTNQDSTTPIAVRDLPRATALAAGYSHTCAVAEGRVYCWGWNGLGQIGYRKSLEASTSPVIVTPPYEGAVARSVVAGAQHTCAVYDDGVLACWGNGSSGQLGVGVSGEDVGIEDPTQVRRRSGAENEYLVDTVQVVAGWLHTCALSAAGTVECWGDNGMGQIGRDPDELAVATQPLRVPGLESLVVDELAAASFLTCARVQAEVWCWGSNSENGLGRDDVSWSAEPTRVQLPRAARRIAVGDSFACAVLSDASLYCWGGNSDGQRGSDQGAGVEPSRVTLEPATNVFAGAGAHVCAIASSGAWCWGRNGAGQLGSSPISEEGVSRPRRVDELKGSLLCPSR